MRITYVRCCDYHPTGESPFTPDPMRPGHGARLGYLPIPRKVTGRGAADVDAVRIREAIADAVEHDHGTCEDAACDIATAIANGYMTVAYHMLSGATEPHGCDAVRAGLEFTYGWKTVAAALGTHTYDCPDWEAWKAHHDRWGRECPSCHAFTYAEPHWEPDACGACGQEYPHPFAGDNRANLPDVFGGVALFAITDDGDTLCERCVTDPSNPVHDCREREDVWHDGWSVVAFDTTGNVEENPTCAHCGVMERS